MSRWLYYALGAGKDRQRKTLVASIGGSTLPEWEPEGVCEDKKIGAESSDPNRHSQPRLPGSVVGEASMRQVAEGGKITKVSALQITEASG